MIFSLTAMRESTKQTPHPVASVIAYDLASMEAIHKSLIETTNRITDPAVSKFK